MTEQTRAVSTEELDAVLREIEAGDRPDPGDVLDLLKGYRRLLRIAPASPGLTDIEKQQVVAVETLLEDGADSVFPSRVKWLLAIIRRLAPEGEKL